VAALGFALVFLFGHCGGVYGGCFLGVELDIYNLALLVMAEAGKGSDLPWIPIEVIVSCHKARWCSECICLGYLIQPGRSIRKLFTLCNVALLGLASDIEVMIHPSLFLMKVLSIFLLFRSILPSSL